MLSTILKWLAAGFVLVAGLAYARYIINKCKGYPYR